MMIPDAVLASMSASQYAAFLNAEGRARMAVEPGLVCFELVEEQEFWAGHGVVTALDLALDLDASFQREMEKQRFYADQDWTPEPAPVDPMPADAGWFI